MGSGLSGSELKKVSSSRPEVKMVEETIAIPDLFWNHVLANRAAHL